MKSTIAEDEREIGKFVKEMTGGVTSELTGMLPHIDLSVERPDSEIKEAILTVSKTGMGKLFQQFGRERVMSYIRDFSTGRRF